MNSGKQKMSVYLPSVFMLFVLLTVFCGVKASADEFKSISFLRNQKVGEYYFSQYGGDFQEITIGVSKTSNGKKTALAKSNPLFPHAVTDGKWLIYYHGTEDKTYGINVNGTGKVRYSVSGQPYVLGKYGNNLYLYLDNPGAADTIACINLKNNKVTRLERGEEVAPISVSGSKYLYTVRKKAARLTIKRINCRNGKVTGTFNLRQKKGYRLFRGGMTSKHVYVSAVNSDGTKAVIFRARNGGKSGFKTVGTVSAPKGYTISDVKLVNDTYALYTANGKKTLRYKYVFGSRKSKKIGENKYYKTKYMSNLYYDSLDQ